MERLSEARQELARILRDREMKNCPLLILANKQDLPAALTNVELEERLELGEICGENRPWIIQKCCAIQGDGLWDGINWLVKQIKEISIKNK